MEWIEWYANQNEGKFEGPLPADAVAQVMHLDGEVDIAPAGEMNWGVTDVPGEIIAYRQVGRVMELSELPPPVQILLKMMMGK